MTAVIVLGPSGLATARRVRDALPGAALHGFGPRVAEGAVAFAEVGAHLRALFASGTPIVGVCAAGVLIRACAPLLADKEAEPPVVAVAEDGSVAVPLLGGHRGANELARRVAAALGGVAAITTAGDLRLGFALDDPPPGWRLADAAAVKPVTAALLAGEPVGLAVETAEADCAWLRRAPFAADGPVRLRVTDRAVAGASDTVVLHPATLAVGVGCERGAPADDLVALVRRALAEAGLAAGSVACVASIALKAAEPAVHEAAAALGVPARFFDAAALAAETPRLANPSDLVFRETGCYGVAEGAALAAAGPAATLVVAKTRSARATCAVARSPRVIDAAAVGRARGRLCIVGIGPGEAAGRTAEAEAALAAATDLVGYRLYLDLLGGLAAGKARHGFELGEEDARARLALDLAAAGRSVALVSSGDPGVYAMASLVFELVERAALSLSKGADDPGWARVELVVLPGVSAMQVAAARVGAPLGHDFCAISLSDLLTPWAAIERRLRAAAAGDFVVALYNPVSRRRRTQLGLAR
ncbi:MAG: cobalamin biosynthesis protein, partial [Dongiaceae bacterium]